jgi:hypothetical protein
MNASQSVYCGHCKKNVPYHYDPVNHWMQLLLSVLTLGLWLPIWLTMSFRPTKLCNECGGPIWADAQVSRS